MRVRPKYDYITHCSWTNLNCTNKYLVRDPDQVICTGLTCIEGDV